MAHRDPPSDTNTMPSSLPLRALILAVVIGQVGCQSQARAAKAEVVRLRLPKKKIVGSCLDEMTPVGMGNGP